MKALVIPSIFSAIDKFSGPMDKMTDSAKRFSKTIIASLERVGKTARNVAVGAGIIGAAIAAPLAYATTQAMDYETGLASLSAITGATGKQFELFKNKVEQVADETKRGPIEVAKAFELAGSAMPELLQSADALGAVSKSAITLSKASGDDLENSIRSLSGAMNQFSLGADQSDRTINVLAAGAKVGAASIVQTSEAMVNFGSVAAGANLSVEQATAAIQVMSKFSLFGAEAGTKLRGSLLKLQQAGVGYKSGQFQINDALAETKAKFDKLKSAKQQDAFLNKAFGAENISTGRILLNNIDLFKEYTAGVTDTSEAFTQAAIRQQTAAKQIEQMRNQLQSLAIKIGEVLLPALNKLINKVSPYVDTTVKWISENKELTKTIVKVAAIAAAFAFTISAVASVIALATKAMLVFNVITGLNPITWLVLAFVGFIALLVSAVKHFESWGAAVLFLMGPFGWLISVIKSLYDNWNMIVDAFKNKGILQGLLAIGKTLLDVILLPLQQILQLASNLPAFLGGNLAASAAGSIENFRNDLGVNTGTEAVNPKAAEQDGIVARSEQTNNASVDINVNDPNKRTTATTTSPGVKINVGSTMAFGT